MVSRTDSPSPSLPGMPLFRRAKKAGPDAGGGSGASPVPPWCAWFGPADWHAFEALLNDVFLDGNKSGPPMRFGEQRHLSLAAEGEPGAPLDLAEIAELVRALPHANWRSATVSFLNQKQRLADRRRELERAGFAEVRNLLMPRLVTVDAVGEGHGLSVALTGELAVVVVIHVGGDLSAPVPPDQFRSWRVDEAEVWAAAMANLEAAPVSLQYNEDENPLVNVEGEGGYTSTHLLRAADLVDRPAPHGILAMVPFHGHLMLWAVEGPELHTCVIAYGPLVRKMWEDAPEEYRLSSRLLWIGEDGIESVGVEPAPPGSDEPGVITGSARFVELLSAFRPPDGHRG
ncbi:hypothetical protein GCM10010425_27180 [Streptomyces spororaveus]|uniref:ESAT-6 protein secretion system EspG family protein n=2 Tax=Streptomyces spororaveus TaxID=284039 RepID=A0ABQ3TI05_9ACTN|nr:hypothetical protein Sspor_55960 [Streptomyces spororaveus]